jgi:hypothetical protein
MKQFLIFLFMIYCATSYATEEKNQGLAARFIYDSLIDAGAYEDGAMGSRAVEMHDVQCVKIVNNKKNIAKEACTFFDQEDDFKKKITIYSSADNETKTTIPSPNALRFSLINLFPKSVVQTKYATCVAAKKIACIASASWKEYDALASERSYQCTSDFQILSVKTCQHLHDVNSTIAKTTR